MTMEAAILQEYSINTARQPISYTSTGPAGGTLMIFLGGWPETCFNWRESLSCFARKGWRCIAPDMHNDIGGITKDQVEDMLELHTALGAGPAIWIGIESGSRTVWSLAAQYPGRCSAIAWYMNQEAVLQHAEEIAQLERLYVPVLRLAFNHEPSTATAAELNNSIAGWIRRHCL
jgi:hypothetical protein